MPLPWESTTNLVSRIDDLQNWADLAAPWQAQQANCIVKRIIEILRDRASASPERRRDVIDEAVACNPGPRFPWPQFHGSERGLAFLYQFAPWADTGSVVATKRIRDRGIPVDVVSCSGSNRRRIDPTIATIAAPYINRLIHLELTQAWASWTEVRAFVAGAMRAAELMGGERSHLYTRAMWVPSHYAGAVYKAKNPDVRWIAEFSDPLSVDIKGESRPGPEMEEADSWFEQAWNMAESRWGTIPDARRGFFSLAEWIVYTLADEVWFTNENQRDLMLGAIEYSHLRDDVLRRSVVSHHPTLPESYYALRDVDYEVDHTKLNLAYFGEFYATRGIRDVTDAMKLLPDEFRSQVHLHVFTSFVPAGRGGSRPAHMPPSAYKALVETAMSGVGAEGIEDQVHINPALPYLDFLAMTNHFDYLIVCDAATADHHEQNPYLPSKWSDYANSRAGTWAFVEPTSVLSKKPATTITPLGNPEEATRDLLKMLKVWRAENG